MPSIGFGCKTILYNRIQIFGSRDSSVLTELMRKTALHSKLASPPNIYQVHSTLPYLPQYAVDMAYVTPHGTDETKKQFKRRMYTWLLRMAEAALGPSEQQLVLNTRKVIGNTWNNLQKTGVIETLKSTCYTTIHKLMRTNDRLAAIHLTDRPTYSRCGQLDSLQHTITDCEEGPTIWNWTRGKLGLIMRMDSSTYHGHGFCDRSFISGQRSDKQPCY